MTETWAIVGAGRVGKTLGLLADRLGISVVLTWNRTEERAREAEALLGHEKARFGPLEDLARSDLGGVDVVWLTVVDSAISTVAGALAPFIQPEQIVLHTAGSLSSRVLTDAGIDAQVGSLHPLQAITDPQAALDALSSVAWTVEGDSRAVGYARVVMAKIDVNPIEIDSEKKTLYHASAVTAANLLVVLMDAAFQMAEQSGASREKARAMLLPLARSCIENLERQDTASALSGPAARGDLETIARHAEALRAIGDGELLAIYELLTDWALKLGQGP